MPLNDFQTSFRDLMLDHPDAVNTPPEAVSSALEADRLSARLKIYRNNIVGSLTDVICASFPIIDALVGREFLELMARSYALENPPRHGCLNQYGEGFDRFIEEFELAQSLPYLPDIARLELAMNAAYYAVDDTALAPEALNTKNPEDLKIPPRTSVHLIASPYPLLDIKEFCEKGGEGEALDLNKDGAQIMVYRPHLDTEIVILDPSEYLMLQNLQRAQRLGDALEETLNSYEGFDVSTFLQKHLTLETFAQSDTNRSTEEQ